MEQSKAPQTLHQFQKKDHLAFQTSSPTSELFSRYPQFSREFSSISANIGHLRELPSLRPIHEPAALQRASETIARLRATLPIHSRLMNKAPTLESVPEGVHDSSKDRGMFWNICPIQVTF